MHVRKNPHGITESFKVCLEFATTYNRAEAMHAAMHKNNTVKKGMRIMKNCVQQLMNASEIDIMECDTQSAAAMTRLRRWALEEGLNGRATLVQAAPQVGVPNFRSIKTIRAHQAVHLKYLGVPDDVQLWSNGNFICVMPAETKKDAGPEGFSLCGFQSDKKAWLMLMLLVAEARGMLADGVRLRGDEGEFLGRYSEVAFMAWIDGLRCGSKEM